MSLSNLAVCAFLRQCASLALSCPSQAELRVAALPVGLIFCIPLMVQPSSLSQFPSFFIGETAAHSEHPATWILWLNCVWWGWWGRGSYLSEDADFKRIPEIMTTCKTNVLKITKIINSWMHFVSLCNILVVTEWQGCKGITSSVSWLFFRKLCRKEDQIGRYDRWRRRKKKKKSYSDVSSASPSVNTSVVMICSSSWINMRGLTEADSGH